MTEYLDNICLSVMFKQTNNFLYCKENNKTGLEW